VPEFLWRARESWLRKRALSPLLVAEAAYRLGAFAHRKLYDLGARRRVRLPARVVSVGNLAVGGSGKTPLVAWLARALHERGCKVAILCRGVGGSRLRDVSVVSDGERALAGPAEVGDEPMWLAGAARGIPVLAGRNRAALGLRALALFGVEALLLDDGFQHHRLERDVDVVCLDARLGLGNGHVLPRGPLREPARALRRAHAFVWTRWDAEDAPPPPGRDRLPAGPPRFHVPIEPTALRNLATGERLPVEALRERRVGLLAAIARPDRLERDLARLGAEVVERRLRADHAIYERREIETLDPDLCWVTTAKDAVKLPADWAAGREVLVLEEQVHPESAAPLADWVLERIGSGDARA
jgi:tetraacyldisaccharide 4'-kinase